MVSSLVCALLLGKLQTSFDARHVPRVNPRTQLECASASDGHCLLGHELARQLSGCARSAVLLWDGLVPTIFITQRARLAGGSVAGGFRTINLT
jgi:hypothetical protein